MEQQTAEQLNERPPASAPGNLAVIAIFIVLLLTPAALALTGHAGFDVEFIQNTERRHPFVAPPVTSGALATAGWERDAEREIADAFPWRTLLIASHNYTKYVWLGDSASTLVIRGTNGWLFLGAEERDYLAGAPTDAVLTRIVDIYAARARWCAQHRMHYVFLLAPNKSTIYPQYLPGGLEPVRPSGADRLLRMLAARGVTSIDVRRELIQASQHGDVYTPYDTHWNDAGAYLAYRATVLALAGAGARDRIAAGAVTQHVDLSDGDLLRLSGIATLTRNPWLHYGFPRRARAVAAPADATDPDLGAYNRAASVVDDPSLPVAMAFGDSFIEQVRPFLAESFRRTIFMHPNSVLGNQFDKRALEAERPTIVIQEIVERNLTFGATFIP